jgi:hypothetical protein
MPPAGALLALLLAAALPELGSCVPHGPISNSSCVQGAAIDSASVVRNGDDYAGVALPAAATIGDCIALCCNDSARCRAFSYNNPQPVASYSCVEGGVCCMLKAAVPPLSNNTYGPAVRTGTVPRGAGPDPPLPPSSFITRVQFGNVSFWDCGTRTDSHDSDLNCGDTWPSTWLADNSTVAWPCDTHGSPMGLWRIDGDPTTTGLRPTPLAPAPIPYEQLCASYGKTGSFPYINVKPGSTIALNGSIFVSVSCMNYGDDAAFNRQHNLGGFLAASTDGGRTFRNVTAVGVFSGVFAAPIFVSCGQNNSPCSDLSGGLLHVFFQGGGGGEEACVCVCVCVCVSERE